MKLRIFGSAAAICLIFGITHAVADAPPEPAPAAPAASAPPTPIEEEAPPPPADVMTPLDRVKSTPVGQLKNPYANQIEEAAKWGKRRYMSYGCNGCHGGGGGGGICPPLSNETWVYGSDDDTVFRLIALGSDEYMKQTGAMRKGRERVVAPMPAFGNIIKTDDELWRIISFMRTTYRGDPARKDW